MPTAPPGRVPPTSPDAPSRVIVRASADFFVRGLAEGVRAYGGLRRAVLFNAILVANVEHITRSAVRNWRYGALDEIPPETERRAISVKRLAESLSAPFETTRANVQGLIDSGVCRKVEGGVIVPNEALGSSLVVASNRVLEENFRRMIAELKAIDFDFAAVIGRGDLDSSLVIEEGFRPGVKAPLRLISRLTSRYYLDAFVAALIICEGGWLDTAVFAATMALNAHEMSRMPDWAWRYSRPDTPPPDSVRRGARIAEAAALLGVDKESVRRRLMAMQAKGWIERGDDGFYASMARMQSPDGRRSAMEVTQAFYRMIHDLAALGVRF